MTTLKDKQVLDLTKSNSPYDLMVSTVEIAPTQEQPLIVEKLDIMSEIAIEDSEQEWERVVPPQADCCNLVDEFPTEINHLGASNFIPFSQTQQPLQAPLAVTAYGIRPVEDSPIDITPVLSKPYSHDFVIVNQALQAINARMEAYSSLVPNIETEAWLRALAWVKTLLEQ